MSGVRPDGRLTFLLCGKKVSKEAHPLSRPYGVPSLRVTHAAGLELATLKQPSRTTPQTHPAFGEPEGEKECLRHSPRTPGPSPPRGEG